MDSKCKCYVCHLCRELLTEEQSIVSSRYRPQVVHTCFDFVICRSCDREFKRVTNKFKPSRFADQTMERKHQQTYKKFLKGKLYPEVQVRHKAVNGAETTTPIKDREFFLVGRKP